MTDAEISKRLALAIGWEPLCVEVYGNVATVWPWSSCGGKWKKFDYRDPAVIWPIAERFNCFPDKWGSEWMADDIWCADTAAKAVALAVIAAKDTQ